MRLCDNCKAIISKEENGKVTFDYPQGYIQVDLCFYCSVQIADKVKPLLTFNNDWALINSLYYVNGFK